MLRFRYLSRALLLSLLWLPVLGAAADLYSAEAEVADEGADSRNRALAQMLGEVLVRVSGNTGIAAQPAARPLLDAAPSLAQQYRYRTVDNADGVVRFLNARFDQAAVESMMRTQGLPVWTQRPRVIMWVATEERAQRALLSLENHPDAVTAARARADERGMPLQLPLNDLEDQGRLSAADIWSDYQPAIREASARYPHDVIVAGRLVGQGRDRWAGSWTLLSRDATQSFDTPPQTLPEALTFAVDQIQNLLAARFAPIPGAGSGDGTLVGFSGIDSLAAYGWLVESLGGLQPVSKIALREVDGDRFTFELDLGGGDADLHQALAGVAGLVPEPGGARVETTADGTSAGFVPPQAPKMSYRVTR